MDLKKLKEMGCYEYLANEYWQMTKEEIKDLALELCWQLEQANGNYEKANKLVLLELGAK